MTRVDAFEKLLDQAVKMIRRAGDVYEDASLNEGAQLLADTVQAVNDADGNGEEIRKICLGE